ncbi:MAG: Maf family nucleotide pyrophosphatase [Alphaproteobacteria bacterium]|jgi:septum formation protein|nr:septum formation protein Maf [Rhodospirillaceae bacterium]MDG2479862.1 Maf family nucleotide pyrophosphatase [Alphaproteobacteria bacterium]MBT6202810.1 septum formation protein Maf [Rhodospirillaceae bacterium]MBT6509043.1 septum formation protein Maf [Rhodospirillaceae bacterium]MBT7613622.1 septum formation protein Maf [Rhodospirillaceae bacterium]
MSVDLAPLVLASKSFGRREMLENAGVTFAVDAANVDEDAVKESLRAENAPVEHVAETLAELKARRVSARHPGVLVLGADSMLECEGRWFDKAGTMDEAREHLEALSGFEHRLVTSAVLVKDENRLWHHTAVARMTMRDLSPAFLDDYLATLGKRACASVGCYQVEGRGLQLFSRIEGDFYAIVGLPMLAVLDQLRLQGVLRP